MVGQSGGALKKKIGDFAKARGVQGTYDEY